MVTDPMSLDATTVAEDAKRDVGDILADIKTNTPAPTVTTTQQPNKTVNAAATQNGAGNGPGYPDELIADSQGTAKPSIDSLARLTPVDGPKKEGPSTAAPKPQLSPDMQDFLKGVGAKIADLSNAISNGPAGATTTPDPKQPDTVAKSPDAKKPDEKKPDPVAQKPKDTPATPGEFDDLLKNLFTQIGGMLGIASNTIAGLTRGELPENPFAQQGPQQAASAPVAGTASNTYDIAAGAVSTMRLPDNIGQIAGAAAAPILGPIAPAIGTSVDALRKGAQAGNVAKAEPPVVDPFTAPSKEALNSGLEAKMKGMASAMSMLSNFDASPIDPAKRAGLITDADKAYKEAWVAFAGKDGNPEMSKEETEAFKKKYEEVNGKGSVELATKQYSTYVAKATDAIRDAAPDKQAEVAALHSSATDKNRDARLDDNIRNSLGVNNDQLAKIDQQLKGLDKDKLGAPAAVANNQPGSPAQVGGKAAATTDVAKR